MTDETYNSKDMYIIVVLPQFFIRNPQPRIFLGLRAINTQGNLGLTT